MRALRAGKGDVAVGVLCLRGAPGVGARLRAKGLPLWSRPPSWLELGLRGRRHSHPYVGWKPVPQQPQIIEQQP